MADSTQNTESSGASLASNILAIVGFIILIVVVIWGLVNLASLSRVWFSSLFGTNTVIEVTAPSEAISGIPFNISWKYGEPTDGLYALLYPCEDGLQIQTLSITGGLNSIPCGAAFTLANGDDRKISLTPRLLGSKVLEVPLSVIFIPSATTSEQAQGSATVAIAPAAMTEPTVETPVEQHVSTPTTPSNTSGQAPATPADLSVRMASVSIDASGQGVATFDIANVGGRSSGTYYFTAQLPTASGYMYSSPAQASLAPGAHVANTLRFSGGTPGVVSVSITTPDSNADNNYASQSVAVSYTSYLPNYLPTQTNYGYPYQYQTYPTYTPNYYGTQSVNQYPYNTYSQQPYPYAQGFGGTQYTQQYPYSTYYPYAY